MKNNHLLTALEHTYAELKETVTALPADDINRIPFEGSWTAGEVVDHVLRSINGMSEVMHWPGKAVTRPAGEKADALKAFMLDYEVKFKSPAFIIPSGGPYDKASLLDSINNATAASLAAAQSMNLEEEVTSFEMPGQGTLTRMEILWFVQAHTTRHIHQLKNILQVLKIDAEAKV